MLIRTVQEISVTKVVTIPSQLCEIFDIKKGTKMCFDCIDDMIVMTPATMIRQDPQAAGVRQQFQAEAGECRNE